MYRCGAKEKPLHFYYYYKGGDRQYIIYIFIYTKVYLHKIGGKKKYYLAGQRVFCTLYFSDVFWVFKIRVFGSTIKKFIFRQFAHSFFVLFFKKMHFGPLDIKPYEVKKFLVICNIFFLGIDSTWIAITTIGNSPKKNSYCLFRF